MSRGYPLVLCFFGGGVSDFNILASLAAFL